MSTGGVFQLLINDGAQDKMLLATEMLRDRLKEVRRLRTKNPAILDKTPTLVDIERTHIFFMHAHFKPFVAIGYEYQKTGPNEGTAKLGGSVTFSIPQFGDFFNDMCVHTVLSGLRADPTALPPSTQVRYCDFLGHRLFQLTKFQVNGNYIDQYTAEVYNFHYAFRIASDKSIGWKRCVGQEVPELAYLTSNSLVDEFREVKFMVNGPQTPKAAHPDVELWIPLLFWFNLDPRLSIPSVAIPYGQRFITIDIAPAALICQGYDAPAFIAPTIPVMEIYINNIFVNPEIHNLFIKRVGFSLIRVYREQNFGLATGNDGLRLDQLKFPTETIYFGARPNANIATMTGWNKYHVLLPTVAPFPVAVPNPGIPPPTWVLGFSLAEYNQTAPVLNTASLETHGVQLWRTSNVQLWNSYIPLTYGMHEINTPDDIGMYMMTFNLYPGSYNPSGYINLSRTRELYLYYTSTFASVVNPCTMLVVGVAINFLLIAQGTCLLRYSV